MSQSIDLLPAPVLSPSRLCQNVLRPNVPEVSYQIRYVEDPKREKHPKANPWSLRHTGVYHQHTKDLDFIILLHPITSPVIWTSLASLGNGTSSAQAQIRDLCDDPFRLHSFLFDVYFDNWRWYSRFLGESFDTEVRRLCSQILLRV